MTRHELIYQIQQCGLVCTCSEAKQPAISYKEACAILDLVCGEVIAAVENLIEDGSISGETGALTNTITERLKG